MKLKYIFASIVATLALAVSCEKEADHYLDELKLSTSYVSLPVAGGYVDVEYVSTDAVTVGETPEWLTVSVATGGNVLRFEAGAGEGRTAEVKLTCAGKTQFVNVIQGLATVSNATCAEVIAGPDSKTYRVTGVVTNIVNTTYGNWYLVDDTGTVYIYGTLDAKGGTKNFLSLGLEEGDEVTVEGPKTTYNGTVELVDVTVLKINKSLIKVEEVEYPEGSEEKAVGIAGGPVKVTLTNKGNGVYVDVPEDALSWLSITSLAGNVVTFTAAPNQGGDRETTVTFRTTDGKKEYSCVQTIAQKGAIQVITAAEFNALEDGTALYRIKGVITEIVMDKSNPDKYNKYGNFYIQDGTGIVYVYGLLPEPNGASGQDVLTTLGAKVGDVITVVGPKASYNGSPQMKNAYSEGLVSVTAATAAEFNALADGTDLYLISGKVTEIVMDKSDPTKYNKYGNFYVTDDSGTVYVYGIVPSSTGASGQDLLTKLDVKVGDIITVVGPKASYNGSAQMKNGYYVSHHADESGDDPTGGDEPGGDEPGSGAQSYELTVASGTNNSYSGSCDIEIGGITWNLTGNSTMDPWRIGGKSITDTDRELYSKTPIAFDVATIAVEHGTVSDITVNSWTLVVSTNADFSSPVSTLTGTVTANETYTFTRPDGVSWNNCYFKFIYNVTVSATSSNKFIQFKKATFTAAAE